MILPHTGYAIHGAPGYSVHGPYDILVHGIGEIRTHPAAGSNPPLRVSLAMYPSSKVFSGAARFSAAVLKGGQQFSDSDLWLPFYPRGLQVEEVCAVLKQEGRRLDKKYKEDKRVRKHLELEEEVLEG